MVFHRADPKNFEGPGGEKFDVEGYAEARTQADLVELISQCCLEHSAKIISMILDEYHVTPRRKRYP